MRKILLFFCASVILYSSCSKDHAVTPAKNNLLKITLLPNVNDAANGTWQQVLGGEAQIQFVALSSDTLSASSIKDSIKLASINTYSKQLVAGAYNITLATESTAVADTFIRFSAQAKNLTINKDQAISLNATTTDGVITISKSQVDTTVMPTFTPAGATMALKFGLANDYYFIYVKDTTTGRITFTAATTGDLYLDDITVSAMNQYDITAVLNTNNVSVNRHLFHLKSIVK
jgi:hypothetical protein